MTWVLIVVAAYVVGMFPSAILVARAAGVDITSVGSGNPGAANITRNLGWKRGAWVFVLDAAKGAAAVGAGLAIDGRGDRTVASHTSNDQGEPVVGVWLQRCCRPPCHVRATFPTCRWSGDGLI